MRAARPRVACTLRTIGAALALLLAWPQSTLAETRYQLEAVGVWRHVEERDDGDTLVEEDGTGGGIGGAIQHAAGNWLLGADGRLISSVLDYDGATQLGAPLTSDTEWLEGRVGFSASRRFDSLGGTFLGGRLRYEHRTREIRSTPAAPGLEERYGTLWLGMSAALKPAPSTTLEVGFTCAVLSEVDVAFDSALDDASLDLDDHCRVDLGAQIDVGRVGRSSLYVRPFVAWERYPRSDAAQLTAAGSPVGRVYLPDTELYTVGVSVGLAAK